MENLDLAVYCETGYLFFFQYSWFDLISTNKPLFEAGSTTQGADCLKFIDRFYNENHRDDIYFDKRDLAVIVCVSGRCGKNGKFLKIAGGNCDIELIPEGQFYIVVAVTKSVQQELV